MLVSDAWNFIIIHRMLNLARAVILAGGLGTRISEETHLKPKPMIEIGGKPILWHIMKIYSHYGVNDFIICLGYKGYLIKEYFCNYYNHTSNITVDLKNNNIKVHNNYSEPWTITLVDTGENTMTGGRLLRVAPYLMEEDHFCLTYGDGVADINIAHLLKFHSSHRKLATMTMINPPNRFGVLTVDEQNAVMSFKEKPQDPNCFANGGFFVLSPKVFEYINEGDASIWERTPLESLTQENQLAAYKHEGFWQAMDTLRDKNTLEELWANNAAPWRVW